MESTGQKRAETAHRVRQKGQSREVGKHGTVTNTVTRYNHHKIAPSQYRYEHPEFHTLREVDYEKTLVIRMFPRGAQRPLPSQNFVLIYAVVLSRPSFTTQVTVFKKTGTNGTPRVSNKRKWCL